LIAVKNYRFLRNLNAAAISWLAAVSARC